MKKVLILMLAVLCISSLAFAINPKANPNADPDEDWAERMAAKALLKSTPTPKIKGSGIPLAAGDYYIPKGSHALGFDSLHIAVDSINANGVTGTVNLILDADTLREPSFTFSADLSVDNNVVVKPAAGRNVCLIVAGGPSHGNGDQMIGFDKGYVTFDGSNNGTDSRNLTVTTEETSVEVPFGLNTSNADTIVVKNLIIKNLDNGVSSFKYGMVSNDVGGNSFTVDNCQIGSTDFPVYRDGIAVWGDWTNGSATAIVTNNEIHAGARGISTYIAGECQFNNNTIYIHPAATTSSYTYAYGIYISWVESSDILNNYINILEKSTYATKIIGISSASNPAGSVFNVVNNMINVGASDETQDVGGIGFVSSSDQRMFNVFNNTILVNENLSTDPCYGIGHINTGDVDVDLTNNIIINNHTGNTTSSCISLAVVTDTLTSNYNVLVSNQNFVNYRGTDYTDLAAWQATSQDVNSVSKDVNFVSASDLHLTGASIGDFDLAGNPIASVTTDIDGDTRSATYPYMGADEGSTTLEPPAEPTVVINEVGEPYEMTNTYNDSYIELYNVTDAAIDISGWKVWSVDASGKGTSMAEIPSGTSIAANGYLLVTRDRTKFLEDYGTYVDAGIVVDPTVTSGSIVYIKDNFYFELKDTSGVSIDKTSSTVSWNSSVFEKTEPTADGLDDANWYMTYQTTPVEGTPGQANSTPPPASPYTITEIQDTTGTGSADSPKNGEMVRTTGIVTGAFSGTYTIQDGTGGFSGIWVNDDLAVTVGDEVTIKGIVAEDYGLTVINADSSGINSNGNTLPAAEILTTGDVGAEQWEGVLVQTSGACDNADLGYGEWSVDDGSGSVVMDDFGYAFTPTVAVEYEITGPLTYSYGAFKILPRDAADVVDLTPPSNDLELTFEDDSDVANWGVYDGTSGYTTVAHNATGGVGGTGAIEFSDGGYGFYIKRPVSGTVGTYFQLTVDVKTAGWDDKDTYPITIAVEGLGTAAVDDTINALADFTTIVLTGTITNADGYIVIAGGNTLLANNVWIDNLIFDDDYQPPVTEPIVAAPTPTVADTNVISLFSNAYTDVTVDTWSASWDNADVADTVVAGDDMKLYTNLVFAGIEFTSQTIDASEMGYFHFDMWTPDAIGDGVFRVKLVDFGADGAWSGGDDVEHELVFSATSDPALETGKWVSFDIPLADFTNLTTKAHLAQLIFSIDDTKTDLIHTVYIDNVYLYKYVPGQDLFFSEYIEGSSQNKALEIYNGKGVDVNLADYSIRGTHNGDADWNYAVFNFPDIVLAAGDVYVLSTTDADNAIKAVADTLMAYETNQTVYFNGDDARALFWGDHMIDVIGLTDGDPGDNWPVAGGAGATSEYTLIRKAEVTMGNTDWNASAGTDEANSEWVVMPQDFFAFLGSFPHDFTGPKIVGVVTVGDSLIQVKYSEKVDSTSAVNVANYSIDGGIGTPTAADLIGTHVVILKLGAGQLLAPNTDYMLTINNVANEFGILIKENTTVMFQNLVPGELPIDIVSTDFESTDGAWWDPTGSGSTWGVTTASTFALSDEAAFHGTKSKKMALVDDPAKSGWFIREYNPNKPDYAVDSKIFMYVKASDPDIQIRFMFRDDGNGGDAEFLGTRWFDVTANPDDWQVVGVDLKSDSLFNWLDSFANDGVITSTDHISLESIQLQSPNDGNVVLYFDDLTERPNIEPVDVTMEVSMAVQALLGNFTIGSDFVDVAGNFNDWGDNAMVLDDSDGDSVYSYTITGLYPGENLEYKFRINGSWDDNTAEFPYGGPARTYTVPDTNSVIFHWYKDEDRSVLGIDDMNVLPKVFALHQNYPNPFNPITTIKYDLPKESNVKIAIYDVMGREVRTLVNTKQRAGYQSVQWNARDNYGRLVSSGYYIYVMQAGDFHKTQKMILLK